LTPCDNGCDNGQGDSGGAERGMSEWWTWDQAVQYVLAHLPCENRENAAGHLAGCVMGDTFPVRWWTHSSNSMIEIAGLGREWVMDRDLGRDPCDRYGVGGEIVLEGAAVRRMCSPLQETAAPVARNGRPPREVVPRLLVLAGMWMDEHGVPVAGNGEQARLEGFLADQAEGQIKSESRIREIAVQAIGIAAAYRKAATR
jgi:hypothetical protein